MPRATTAACDVLPPRLVRIACAAKKPWMSSGLVSSRTRITFSPCLPRSSAVSASNTTWPDAAPGDAGSPCASGSDLVRRIELRHQQLLQQHRVDARERAFLRDESVVGHLDRRDDHRARVHLAVARLQAVEAALLDRELEVLHFLVVRLELVAQRDELAVQIRHLLRQRRDRFRRADAGDDVLALRIGQVFAVDHVLAGARDCA